MFFVRRSVHYSKIRFLSMLPGVIQIITVWKPELSNFWLKMEFPTLMDSDTRRVGFCDGCY